MSECTVPGCARNKAARGWCLPHYKRWRRRGSVEDIKPEQRFFAHVTEGPDGCWDWDKPMPNGYGQFDEYKRDWLAHRWSYQFMRAEIPKGLTLDHLCRNRRCVNPWHLEPVPQRVNVLRGETIPAANAAKAACERGHPFDAANTYICSRGKRNCRICRREASRRSKSRRTVGTVSGG